MTTFDKTTQEYREETERKTERARLEFFQAPTVIESRLALQALAEAEMEMAFFDVVDQRDSALEQRDQARKSLSRWRLACACVAAIGLGLALSGCAPAAPNGPLVLSPDAEALQYAGDAAARWMAATGLEIVVGSGGVPVTFGDYPLDHRSDSCSASYVTRRADVFTRASIVITRPVEDNSFCAPVGELMLHEVGHVLQERADQGGDAARGHVGEEGNLMSEFGTGDGLIDAESLAKVCSRAPCSDFVPER